MPLFGADLSSVKQGGRPLYLNFNYAILEMQIVVSVGGYGRIKIFTVCAVSLLYRATGLFLLVLCVIYKPAVNLKSKLPIAVIAVELFKL